MTLALFILNELEEGCKGMDDKFKTAIRKRIDEHDGYSNRHDCIETIELVLKQTDRYSSEAQDFIESLFSENEKNYPYPSN